MADSISNSRIRPAQLSFLAIYNPAFGQDEDTSYEQIFCYCSPEHAAKDGDVTASSGIAVKDDNITTTEEEQNKRLRQIGLARGMVEFANNFSSGIPVDSIETEKSRIILKELEPGWWILASIDLTRLPAAVKAESKESKDITNGNSASEYSAREVAPSQLLVVQLQQAHAIFLLHQAASINELLQKQGRERFENTLSKFWSSFATDWDVLLHANPAVGIYNSIKLAGGGELGMGVGEEEWGSGEREVLEDFVQRTEGLVDVLVGRYGDTPLDTKNKEDKNPVAKPWLGLGDDPRATDGLIFLGVGNLSKRSIATVSQWMDTIFKHGQHAYGVADNPSSRPRHRKKARKAEVVQGLVGSSEAMPTKQAEAHSRVKSPSGKALDYRRKAIENAATPPGIPAPLVSAVERSLDNAQKNLERKEHKQDSKKESTTNAEQSSLFDGEKMMGYLKLGYGSSWTLHPKGFQKEENPAQKDEETIHSEHEQGNDQPEPELQQVDPTPEVSDDEGEKEKAFVQHLEQSIGRFLIGLSGDLENAEFEDEGTEFTAQSRGPMSSPKRIFMRTLTVQMSRCHTWESQRSESPTNPNHHSGSPVSSHSIDVGGPKTSAAASVDRTVTSMVTEKVRIVVYVHQPFIFAFLFGLQTPSLTIPSFYRGIHHQLGPLQKPLLRSTDPSRIPERVLSHLGEKMETVNTTNGLYDLIYDPAKLTVRTSIPNIPLPGTLAAEGILASSSSDSQTVSGSWYTLGIPIGSAPGTSSAATSNSSDTLLKSEWTRLEALNVHMQILNMWTATRKAGTAQLDLSGDLEQTVKTSRGWWVVWMRVPPPMSSTANTRPSSSATMRHWREHIKTDDTTPIKEAFLVRKSVDTGTKAREANAKSGNSGKWLLRDQNRDASGSTLASQAAANTTARGVIEGVGVDAKRWVEGLSRLS